MGRHPVCGCLECFPFPLFHCNSQTRLSRRDISMAFHGNRVWKQSLLSHRLSDPNPQVQQFDSLQHSAANGLNSAYRTNNFQLCLGAPIIVTISEIIQFTGVGNGPCELPLHAFVEVLCTSCHTSFYRLFSAQPLQLIPTVQCRCTMWQLSFVSVGDPDLVLLSGLILYPSRCKTF